MRKITLEQKKRAVEIALEGGNPLPYLKECGSKKPECIWYTIKQNLKVADPETFEKLPERIGAKPKEEKALEKPDYTMVFGDGESIIPADSEIADDEPSHFFKEDVQDTTEEDDLEIAAVRNKKLGEFHLDKDGCITWKHTESNLIAGIFGGEISMRTEGWLLLMDLMPVILRSFKIDKNGDEI